MSTDIAWTDWEKPGKKWRAVAGDIVFLHSSSGAYYANGTEIPLEPAEVEKYLAVVSEVADDGEFTVVPFEDGKEGDGTDAWWDKSHVQAYIPSRMRKVRPLLASYRAYQRFLEDVE